MATSAPSAPLEIPPWTLRAAAGLASLQAAVEVVAVARRHELTPGLRTVLVASLALTWPLAWGALRRRAGAALGLLLLEGTTVVAALGAVDSSGAVRLALGGTAVAVLGLLLGSLHAFPSPTLPKT